MKKILRLELIIVMIIMMSGCGTKSLDETSDTIMNVADTDSSYTYDSYTDISIADIPNMDISNADSTNTSTNTLEIPAPTSNASVDWECGTYYSDISEENLGSYLKLLVENGWKDLLGNSISTEVADGTSEYTLYKGNNLLQIMTFLVNPEVSICNGILIKLDKNIAIADINNRSNALSKSEALEKIQDNIENMPNQEEILSTRRMVTGVFEIFIDDAFEKMNLQAYAAISDNGFTGCFLIRKDVVSHIPGSLSNTCVADIDVDSKYELIDLYGFGSGIFRYQLTAYDFAILPNYCSSIIERLNRKYYNCFVPKRGYAELVLKKIDDTTVKLVGDGKEYGTLKVNGQNLVVENMLEFPFEEWSKTYDQIILPDLAKEIPDYQVLSLADKLNLKEEDTNSINKSFSNNAITMSVVSSHVIENTAVVMLTFTKDSNEVFGNGLNPIIEKLITGNNTIENNMLISELSNDRKTLYCYLTWHTEEPIAGKTVKLKIDQLICNESQIVGKTFSDQVIDGKWSLDFSLEANTSNIKTGKNMDLSKTVSMCGKELQIDSVKIADLQVIVNTTTLSDTGKPVDPLSNVSTDSGMYYGVSVAVIYADGSQSEEMECTLDKDNKIIAYSFNALINKKIKEVHVKDVVILIE